MIRSSKMTFFRTDMKHSYFSNYLFAINFSVVETVVVCQKKFMFMHMFLLYKVTNLTLYMYILVHRNVLMYVILACHLFM